MPMRKPSNFFRLGPILFWQPLTRRATEPLDLARIQGLSDCSKERRTASFNSGERLCQAQFVQRKARIALLDPDSRAHAVLASFGQWLRYPLFKV